MKKLIKYFVIFTIVISISILNIPIPQIYKTNHIEFYDKDNNLITSQINNKTAEYIYLHELDDYTINAFIAFEDKNFFSHNGFDFLRIIKSFFKNISTFSFSQGASTISQQYARTVFLNNKKTISRKLKEIYYTIKLENKYSKERILEGYLNSIYLGHGCYGIDAASKFYFNKSAKDLDLNEAATLASLPSSPNNSSPFINYQKSQERKKLVLKAMKEEGYIDVFEYKDNEDKNLNLNTSSLVETNIYYYLDKVKEEIKIKNISLKNGLKVYTNIDTSLYSDIVPIVSKYSNTDSQLSILILENNTNRVLLNIGGFDYEKSKYNRSLNSKRQVGSTIKTFLYSLALENNFTLNTKLKSEPVTFNIKGYGQYAPSNSNNKYANAPITMKEAYAVSDNIYAIKTLLILGTENFINYLKKFKLTTIENVPSIALGTCELSLFDLVKAYSVYANEGHYNNYSFINKITDSIDNILYENKFNKSKILKISTVKKVKELMKTPFKNEGYYTKTTLQNYKIKNFYGKSGSTSTDSYLMAFNDKYTIGIWMGNDDYTRLYDYTSTKYMLKDISKII